MSPGAVPGRSVSDIASSGGVPGGVMGPGTVVGVEVPVSRVVRLVEVVGAVCTLGPGCPGAAVGRGPSVELLAPPTCVPLG